MPQRALHGVMFRESGASSSHRVTGFTSIEVTWLLDRPLSRAMTMPGPSTISIQKLRSAVHSGSPSFPLRLGIRLGLWSPFQELCDLRFHGGKRILERSDFLARRRRLLLQGGDLAIGRR